MERITGGKVEDRKIVLALWETNAPCSQVPGTSTNVKKNPDLKQMEDKTNSLADFVTIGGHAVKPIGQLKVLEKEPLLNYFGGTRKKKESKKKVKEQKEIYNLSNLVDNLPQVVGEVESSQKVTQKESVERELEKTKILLRMNKYLKVQEESNSISHFKQRRKEEDFLWEQEKMMETYLEHIQSRQTQNKIHELDEHIGEPLHEKIPTYVFYRTGLSSRRLWNDQGDFSFTKRGKKMKRKPTKNL